jgi:hypothetical protein
LGLGEDENQDEKNQAIPPEASKEIQKNIGRMPDRQIFDFLVQYYVTEVHWLV